MTGRNFEYISGEDPYLGWAMVQPLVTGIQSNNVVANAKHWVMNNQESNRHGDTAVVDERTRFEMYYPPFAGAVQAGVGSVMCSYNLIQALCACGRCYILVHKATCLDDHTNCPHRQIPSVTATRLATGRARTARHSAT